MGERQEQGLTQTFQVAKTLLDLVAELGEILVEHRTRFFFFPGQGQADNAGRGVMKHLVRGAQIGKRGVFPKMGVAIAINPFAKVAFVIASNHFRREDLLGGAVEIGIQTCLPVFMRNNGDIDIQIAGSLDKGFFGGLLFLSTEFVF